MSLVFKPDGENPGLLMWRPNTPLPHFPLAKGYTLRLFKKGDEIAWCESMLGDMGVNEASVEQFNKKMGDKTVKADSIFVIADENDKLVATATAQKKRFGEPWLHMVAVHKDARGKKLGKPVVAAVLQKHLDAKKDGCYLITQEYRTAAVKMYLDLGFYPIINHPSYRKKYEQLAHNYNLPYIKCIDENRRLCDDILPINHGMEF